MYHWLQTHIPPWAILALVIHLVVLGTVAYLILLERKIASWVQDRIGPNRVGLGGLVPLLLLPLAPFVNVERFENWLRSKKMMGLGQPLADGLKFILKEDYRPKGADKYIFTLAPAIMIIVVIISIAVVPWGGIKETALSVDVTEHVSAADAAEYNAMVAAGNVAPGSEQRLKELTGRLGHGLRAEVVGRDLVQVSPGALSIETREDGTQRVKATGVYQYHFQIAKLDIGALFVIAILSLAVYGVVLGGWASNNKYSFLGGLRATAQMVSYEIPLGVSLLCVVIMFGSLELNEIVDRQTGYWAGFIPRWNVFCQPLAFLLFLICIHAEANRAPFDLAEAEQELVGGYHTEYSSMRFALFFLAEYAGMITTSAVCVAAFFGGWHLPGLAGPDPNNPGVTGSLLVCLLRTGVFFAKTLIVIAVFMWVRWSLPRFRFDQLMMLAWRALIPMSLGLLVMTALAVYFYGGNRGDLLNVHGRLAIALLVGNAVVLAASMLLSTLLPPAPETNRKIKVAGSRFEHTPLPAGTRRPVGA